MFKKLLALQIILFVKIILAQDYPLAPEIWSEPELIVELSHPYKIFEHPTLNSTLDTMYLGLGNGIYRSILVNGKWSEPEFMPQLHHGGAATRHPSLSRDGKRIYYTNWGGYGNWDIYVNNWVDSTKSWGVSQNLGPEINTSSIEFYAYEVSKDTLYCVVDVAATLGPAKYIKNSLTNKWELIIDFAEDHPLNGGSLSGLSLTTDRKKMYFSQWLSTWTDYRKKGTELCVTYWDTLNSTWGETYFLNINSEAVILDYQNTLGGWDGNPWITDDGKTLFFSSSRNINWVDSSNTHDIYISYLLVDENGDSVTTVKNFYQDDFNFALNQNYPNPFNPTTIINYTLNQKGFVKLIIYDSLGRKIAEPIKQIQNKGSYKYIFDAKEYNLSSGVYYYQFFLNGNYKVKKMILTK